MFFKDVTTEDTTSANICDFTIKNFGCCNEIYYTNKYIIIKCKNFINWFVSGMPSTFSTPSPPLQQVFDNIKHFDKLVPRSNKKFKTNYCQLYTENNIPSSCRDVVK